MYASLYIEKLHIDVQYFYYDHYCLAILYKVFFSLMRYYTLLDFIVFMTQNKTTIEQEKMKKKKIYETKQ